MFVKGLALTALVASTPIALVVTQDPKPATVKADSSASATAAEAAATAAAAAEARARQVTRDLDAMRRELDAARSEMKTLRAQIDQALDQLDRTYEVQRDRNCSPSRSRALMSHYLWLRDQGHATRAKAAVAKVVDQFEDDVHQLNRAAWQLMTDKETAGKFDEVALAFAERMEKHAAELDPRLLDTVAMAHFLNGQIDRAVALQAQAIQRGGNGDEFRRRLRTYQAAQVAIAKANAQPAAQPATMVAVSNDD